MNELKSRKTKVITLLISSIFIASGCAPDGSEKSAGETKKAQAETIKKKENGINLETVTIKEIQEALNSGRLTSVDLTKMYIDRIEMLNTNGPGLNAVRSINPNWKKEAKSADKARKKGNAKGMMAGIPVLLKDNIDAVGMPTTGGSLALEDSFPSEDAPIVKELKEAGAIILGKVNMHELAGWVTFSSPEGYSSLGGMALNPYDVSLSPGSSSSGSGVAAAVALSAITVGTDTGGSIMNPAAIESLAAVRPTVGLISRNGIIPITANQDTPGPMGRNVYDVAVGLSSMTTGADPEDDRTAKSDPYDNVDYTKNLTKTALKNARIGVPLLDIEDKQEVLWNKALEKLEEQGATLVKVPVNMNPEGVGDMFLPTYEFAENIGKYFDNLPEDAPIKDIKALANYYRDHPQTMLKFGADNLFNSEKVDLQKDKQRADAIRAEEVAASKNVIDKMTKKYDIDAFVFPNGTSVWMSSKSGYPAVAVPAGYETATRHPFGISFLGNAAYTEEQLLGYAYSFEQATHLRKTPEEINPSLFRCTEEGAASCAP